MIKFLSPFFRKTRLKASALEDFILAANGVTWTDSNGHVIIHVQLGCSGDIFVAATIQLERKEKNLGAAIIDTRD